jgi:hypothetical protein
MYKVGIPGELAPYLLPQRVCVPGDLAAYLLA